MKKIGRVFLLVFLVVSAAAAQRSSLSFFDASSAPLTREFTTLDHWSFFPDQLLDGRSVWPDQAPVPSIHFASLTTYGTFALKVRIDPSLKNSPLALEVPSLFSSYIVLVDGKQIGAKGKVGTDARTSEPDIKPAVYTFTPVSDTVLFVVQATNFHPGPGGIKGVFRLAAAPVLQQRAEILSILDYCLFLVLLIIGIVSLCLYYVRFEHQRVFLFLALFVFAWFMRCVFGYHYRILDWVNVPWAWLMRMEYLSLMFTTVFAMHFIASLFPNDFKKWVRRVTDVIIAVFSVSIVVLPADVVVPAISIYLGFSSVVLSYILFVIIKAFVDNRGGATMMLVTMFSGSLMFGYIIACFLAYLEINMFIYDIGFVVLAILIVISVSVRLSRIDRLSETSVLTLEHFFGENSLK